MRPIAPRICGLEETQLDGERYKVLPAAIGVTDDGTRCIISRWRLTAEERVRVMAGEDLFLCFTGERMQPVQMHVGWPHAELET